MRKSKTTELDEARQHRLTDFLRRILHSLLAAGTLIIGLLLLAPLTLYGESPSKPSQQNSKKSKPSYKTPINMLRRSQMEQVMQGALTTEEAANLGLLWLPSETVIQAYQDHRTNSKTSSHTQDKTSTSPNAETSSKPSELNLLKDSD